MNYELWMWRGREGITSTWHSECGQSCKSHFISFHATQFPHSNYIKRSVYSVGTGTAILDLPIQVPMWEGTKLKYRKVQYSLLHICAMRMCKNCMCVSYLVDLNSQFILNLFVEFALFVTQCSWITFVNSGESENSNDKRELLAFIWICITNLRTGAISRNSPGLFLSALKK